MDLTSPNTGAPDVCDELLPGRILTDLPGKNRVPSEEGKDGREVGGGPARLPGNRARSRGDDVEGHVARRYHRRQAVHW